jgi:hypothetical protein
MVTRPTLAALLGFEPPLPGELDAMRDALAEPLRAAPVATSPRSTPRTRAATAGDGQRSLFSA